jgi:hypothetical protein
MYRPKVFLSFAGNDRPMAERLAADLLPHGVETFIDADDIPPGADLVLSINKAMAESDHYVLLWSRNCLDRPWVEAEWAAAYARQLNERRSFLFVVRLDETPLPLLLSVRRYLDGFRGWPAVAPELAAHWRGDLGAGTPVFPPPSPARVAEMAAAHNGDSPTRVAEPSAIAVLVRNWALGVSHVVGVAPESTGEDLLPTVRTTLALPDSQSQLDGALEVRFSYRLLRDGDPIPDKPLADQGIIDGVVLNLEVRVQASGPDGPFGEKLYRGTADVLPGVSERSIRALVDAAFAHLLP